MEQYKDSYWIPQNVSRSLGMIPSRIRRIPMRRWIEAGAMMIGLWLLLNNIPFTRQVGFYITLFSETIVCILNLHGIKDESVTQFLFGMIRFYGLKTEMYLLPPTPAVEEQAQESDSTFSEREEQLQKLQEGMDDDTVFGDKRKEVVVPKSGVQSDNALVERLKHPIQRWFPIKDLLNDGTMVIEIDGYVRYVRFIEVQPVNLLLMSMDEKAHAIKQFMENFVFKSPERFSFMISTKDEDATEILYRYQANLQSEPSPVIKELGKERIRFYSQMAQKSKDTQYLLVYEYQGDRTGKTSTELTEIVASLDEMEREIRYNLNICGLGPVVHEDELNFRLRVLHEYCSGRYGDDLDTRLSRINRDAAILQGTSFPKLCQADVIAPKSINFEHPGYNIINGWYQTHLYITSEGYPEYIPGGWGDVLNRYGKNVSVSISFDKMNREAFLRMADQTAVQLNRNANSAIHKGKSPAEIEETGEAFSNHMRVIQAMRAKNEDLFSCTTIFAVRAATLKELDAIVDNLKKDLRGKLVTTTDCLFRNEDAQLMSWPLNYRALPLTKKASRNFLSSSVAALFPFTSRKILQENGTILGFDPLTGSLVAVDIFDHKKYTNSNIIVFGTAGAGKTYFEMLMGTQMRVLQGYQTLYVLPSKGYEYQNAIERMNGEYITLSGSSPTIFNIFEIHQYKDPDEEILKELGVKYEPIPFVQSHMQVIKTFISLLSKNSLTPSEEGVLDKHLTRLYTEFGIDVSTNNSNRSVEEFTELVRKGEARWPQFSDLQKEIENDKAMSNIYQILSPFFPGGSFANFDGQSNIDLDNKVIAFNVDDRIVPDSFMPAILFLAVSVCYNIMRRDRTEHNILFLDEVWKITKNTYSADFIEELYRVVRGYGAAVCSATQDIRSFMAVNSSTGSLSQAMLNNSAFTFIKKTPLQREAELVQEFVGLTNEEVERIRNLERGMSYLIIGGGERLNVVEIGTLSDERAFTTDPEKLRAYKRLDMEALERKAGAAI